MSLLNSALGRLLDGLLRPLAGLPAEVGVILWSLLAAVLMLLVVKRTSNQAALEEVKRRIHACLFEIRLFNDDLGAILRAQLELLRHNGRYLLLSLPPLLWMIVPLALLIAQLQAFYGWRALHPGEEFLVRAELASGWQESVASSAARPSVELSVPDGLELSTPGVWTPALGEMAWRLRAERAGRYELGVRFGDASFSKSVAIGDAVVRLSPERPSAGFFDQLAWTAERPLPASSPLHAIAVDYPAREMSLVVHRFSSEYAWMVVFFLVSMILAFALKKPFGVTL
jgi:uncharacterized membrane protein (DUF106 family)